MTRDLLSLVLLLAAIGWALAPWPGGTGGVLGSFAVFLALLVGGVLLGGDREGDPR